MNTLISEKLKKIALNIRMTKYKSHGCTLSEGELKKVRMEKIGEYQGFHFYFTNGEYVRDNVDIDYAAGGNPARYHYIPENEIWIEKTPQEGDWAPTMAHEYIEMKKMQRGVAYGKAHDDTAAIEKKLRKDFKPSSDIMKDFIGFIQTEHKAAILSPYDKKVNTIRPVRKLDDADVFLDVPSLRQYSDYDCGATCFLSVLGYYGYDLYEEKVMKIMEVKHNGVDPIGFERAAEKFNLKCKMTEKMTCEDVRDSIKEKIPVILSLQAWGEKKDYTDNWKDGHYVVAVGYDKRGFFLMDPSQIGYSYISDPDLMERWHEKDTNKISIRLGIMIYGKKPKFDYDQVKPIR